MCWCERVGLADQDVEVEGTTLRVHLGGSGPPLVLLHGNPTHAFLWRRVIPALLPSRRCLAIDLAGFGASQASAGLGVVGHARLVADVVRELVDRADEVSWLTHDWGVAIGFLAAAQTVQDRGHRIAFCEGHVRWIPSWETADPGFASLFRNLRDPAFGNEFVVRSNRSSRRSCSGRCRTSLLRNKTSTARRSLTRRGGHRFSRSRSRFQSPAPRPT